MSNKTEKMIQAGFKKLLRSKSFNKITVQDIADECGINRNTFYYHYQDIPSMLETLVNEEISALIANSKGARYEDDMDGILNYIHENASLIKNVYMYSRRDVFDKQLLSIIEHYARKSLQLEKVQKPLTDLEKKSIIEYCKMLYFGVIISFLSSNSMDMASLRSILNTTRRILEHYLYGDPAVL